MLKKLTILLIALFSFARFSGAQTLPDPDTDFGDSNFTFKGTIAFPSDEDVILFRRIEGSLLGFTITGNKPLLPNVQLIDLTTEASLDLTGFVKGLGTKTITISKFPAPTTGSYALVITSSDGSIGKYTAKSTSKLPKTATTIKLETGIPANDAVQLQILAMPNAKLNATIEPSKNSPASIDILGLIDPDSNLNDISAFLTTKGGKRILKNVPLATFGEYGLAFQNSGQTGNVKISATIKQPPVKMFTFTEPEESLSPGSIAGTIDVQAIDASPEVEPNDSLQTDQFVGALSPGTVLRVSGSTTAAGGGDIDLYRYVVSKSQTITVTLLHNVNNDFDFALVDPQTGQAFPGLTFATTDEPEIGIINLTFQGQGQAAFDIAVVPFSGSGSYLLTVVSAPPASSLLAASGAAGGALAMSNLAPFAAAQRSIWSDAQVDRALELDKPFVPGEFVVQLRDPKASATEWAARQGLGVRAASPGGAFVATVPGLSRNLAADRATRLETMRRKQQIRSLSDVDFAEPNYIYKPAGLPATGNTPDDPFFGLQWHYSTINVPQAWNITKGSPNVIVAILDTGVTAHPDLLSRDSGTGFDMISDPQISNDGNGFDNDPTDPGDLGVQGKSSWHGTHVAGTIGAATNNGVGVAGIDWFCKLMHIRVLGVGGGTNFDIGEGMKYAAKLANASGQVPPTRANVINMSLGGPGSSQNQQNIINQVRAAGVAVIAAAGNENSSTPSFPASYNGVISVAAVDFAKNRAPYSNFGPTVDVAAPGGDVGADLNQDNFADGVLSTLVDDSAQPFKFIFKFYQGTSMACPHVVGVAALLYSVNPTLTPDQIEQILESTAVDLGTPGFDNIFGHGLIDAFAAVQAAQPANPGAPAQIAASSSALDFGDSLTSLHVSIANIGGGTLNFSTSDTEDFGGNWLSVSPANGTAPAALTISVSRSGLVPGFYTGKVTVTSNGGNATVDVTMQVPQSVAVPINLGTIFVLAVDSATLTTTAQAVMQQNGTYSITNIPPGSYLIVAGADLDGDDSICGKGEPCGVFPSFETPIAIDLPGGGAVSGVDFSILADAALPSMLWLNAPELYIPSKGFKLKP
jgi:serine protease